MLNRAIVTGGCGFIGSLLVEMLVAQKVEVVVIDDLSSGDESNLDGIDCVLLKNDVTDYSSLKNAFTVYKPDVVFHLAAKKRTSCDNSPMLDLLGNAGSAMTVARACVESGVKRLVYSSTGSVYGNTPMPITEQSACQPLTYYGVSKLTAENYIKMFHRIHGLEYVILRYFHVYGPKQRSADNAGGVIGIFCRRAIEGKPLVIFGDGQQVRLFTFVGNVANATYRAGVCAPEFCNTVYNVTSNAPISIRQVADQITKHVAKGKIEHKPARRGDIKSWSVSNKKIQCLDVVHWMRFKDGLDLTFDWYAGML